MGRKKFHDQKALRKYRRRLRKQATPAEKRLWKMLRRRRLKGRKFRRQHSIGPYIVDFYCPAERLAVELDGASHENPTRRDYDAERTAFLEEHGIRVVRFENRDVFDQPDIVLSAIVFHFSYGTPDE